jgi:hypothetical protein
MSSQAAMETGIWNKSIGVHLRLTRKQARAVADAHYDCCMQLSWSDIDKGAAKTKHEQRS